MTAFALVGSTGKSFERGIGTYGLMASISGLVHAAVFFIIGIRLWAFGKKYGYVTQIQFFRARFESDGLGYLLFPILVLLVVPYLLIGIIGAGKTIEPVTAGAFPAIFTDPSIPAWLGGVPPWLTGLVVCVVVLAYVFMGGSRGAAYANTFQTIVFMFMGLVAFVFIVKALGGIDNAGNVAARITEDGKIVQDFRFDKKVGALAKNVPPKPIGRLLESDRATELANVQPHFTRTPIDVEFKKKNPKTGKISSFERQLRHTLPDFSYLSLHSAQCGHVPAPFPALANGQERQGVSPYRYRPSAVYHGGLGAVRSHRCLGLGSVAAGNPAACGTLCYA